MACAICCNFLHSPKRIALAPLNHSSSPLPTRFFTLSFLPPPLPSTCSSSAYFAFSAYVRKQKQLCLAAAEEYVFPDPIPEFAESETIMFRNHLLEKLSKKDLFRNSVEEVVGICTEILSNFLHAEYGGPGTLSVIPFIDMADTINERGLPGGPQAARAAVVWAQKHVDNDWKEWTGGNEKD